MTKTITTEYPVIELIKNRWSPRSFSDKALTETDIKTVVEAASWAPSAFNEQPWQFYYALRGGKGFERMLDCLSAFNQLWVKNAAALVLSIGKKNFANGECNTSYAHDCGLANATMLMQATSMGFYGHPMTGYFADKIVDLFKLDETLYAPVCMTAFGYLDSPDKLVDEMMQQREAAPRVRKPLNEILEKF